MALALRHACLSLHGSMHTKLYLYRIYFVKEITNLYCRLPQRTVYFCSTGFQRSNTMQARENSETVPADDVFSSSSGRGRCAFGLWSAGPPAQATGSGTMAAADL